MKPRKKYASPELLLVPYKNKIAILRAAITAMIAAFIICLILIFSPPFPLIS